MWPLTSPPSIRRSRWVNQSLRCGNWSSRSVCTEGTALALALRRMASPRPLTHELFMEVMQRSRIDVVALRLMGRENGNYLAELDLMLPSGRERVVLPTFGRPGLGSAHARDGADPGR